MKVSRRSVSVALGCLLGAFAGRGQAASGFGRRDLYGLVGKSSRLSVLAGRITRSQAQRVLGVLPAEANAALPVSTQEAHQLMTELGGLLAGTPVQTQAQSALQAYGVMLQASAALSTPDHSSLVQLARSTGAAVESVDALTTALLPHLGHPMAHMLLMVAQMQRQSQHLAARFMVLRTGISDPAEALHLQQGREVFSQQVGTLQAASLQTARIREQLGLLSNQWLFMNAALAQTSKEPHAMENVCTTSERMLEVLAQLYPEYEAALRQTA